jgi:hypothetical protein
LGDYPADFMARFVQSPEGWNGEVGSPHEDEFRSHDSPTFSVHTFS